MKVVGWCRECSLPLYLGGFFYDLSLGDHGESSLIYVIILMIQRISLGRVPSFTNSQIVSLLSNGFLYARPTYMSLMAYSFGGLRSDKISL